jgi:hypothetical protein
MTDTASDFIARKSAEWERERARGKLIRMKDVNREAIHVYRRDAWTFLVQDTYGQGIWQVDVGSVQPDHVGRRSERIVEKARAEGTLLDHAPHADGAPREMPCK